MISAFTIYWLMLTANNFKFAYPVGRFVALAIYGIILIYIFYQLIYWFCRREWIGALPSGSQRNGLSWRGEWDIYSDSLACLGECD